MKTVKRIVVIIAVILIALIIMAVISGVNDKDALQDLQSAPISTLTPTGELVEIFEFGGKATDIQRENKLKEIKGSVVVWQLPVFEVKRDGSNYRVQTQNPKLFGKNETMVPAIITLTALTAEDKAQIEALKTGDTISIKGVIKGERLRHLLISPAYLYKASSPKAESNVTEVETTTVSEVEEPATLGSSDSIAHELKLKNGVVAINEFGTVLFNAEGLKNESGVLVGGSSFAEHWQQGDADVVLIKEGCAVENCGMQDEYKLVFVNKSGSAKVSPSFGDGSKPAVTHHEGVVNFAFGEAVVTLENGVVQIPDALKR